MVQMVVVIPGLVVGAIVCFALVVLAIVLACLKCRRAALVLAIVAALMLLLTVCLAAGVVGKGVRGFRAWRAEVAANNAADKARRDALVARLMSYLDPAVRNRVPTNFYTQEGFRDWWRYPLVYPYSITAIDADDFGSLGREDDGNDPRIADITHVAMDGRSLLIRQVPRVDSFTPGPQVNWILLDWSTGEHVTFPNKAAMLADANQRGYTGPDKLTSLPRWGRQVFRGAP